MSAEPSAQVFRSDAPEPGPGVIAVIDNDADIYRREGQAWRRDGSPHIIGWTIVIQYWPLLRCPADFLAALDERADLEELAGLEAAADD